MTLTRRRQTDRPRALDLLAGRIKGLMSERKLNARQVAKAVNVSEAQISHLLNRKRGASFETVDALARLFGIPVAELFSDPAMAGQHLDDGALEFIHAYRMADGRIQKGIRALLDIYDQADVHEAALAAPVSAEDGDMLLAALINSLAHQRVAPGDN